MQSLDFILGGVVVETRVRSFAGKFIYSDRMYISDAERSWNGDSQPFLNRLAATDVLGIAAGVARMAIAIIHIIAHVFAAVVTCNKGHAWHAIKGGCEFLKGFIEAIPILGRVFACNYNAYGEWWIIKIYNPSKPDSLDRYMYKWGFFKEMRPNAYFKA